MDSLAEDGSYKSQNKTQTSLFGDRLNAAPKTEVRKSMRLTQTSLFGDITQDSPKTEDAEAQYRIQTSIIGDKPYTSPKTAVTDPENRTLTSCFGEIIEDPRRSTPRNRRPCLSPPTGTSWIPERK